MHEDVEGWILGAQLHHSLPYYLVSGSLTEPGARLMASSPRDLVPPIVLRLQECTATIHGFVYMSAENLPLLLHSPSLDRFYLCGPGCFGLAP